MEVTEIILMILGILVIALSFLLPDKKAESKDSIQINEEEMRELIDKEVKCAQDRIQDIVEETVAYSMEKTERTMEKLTNEKMMAVNEYSDSVLEQIDKNHKEAVFLYDMLNDKHENLKETIRKVNQTVSEANQPAEEKTAKKTVRKARPAETKTDDRNEKAEKAEKAEKIDLSSIANPGKDGRNSNSQILKLHKEGKSNMAIAKELGLGIGEVKLVIDLFEGI